MPLYRCSLYEGLYGWLEAQGIRDAEPELAIHHVAEFRETEIDTELRPALKSETFFETVFGLQRDGSLVAGKTPSLLMMAPILVEYENWMAGPPLPLQKLPLSPLASLGRRLGYPPRYPRYSDD